MYYHNYLRRAVVSSCSDFVVVLKKKNAVQNWFDPV